MTDTAITITAIIGFLAGAATIGMWLGPAISRVRTERDRLQSVVDSLRAESDAMTDKIAKLTADCVEFQRLAHQAQEKAERWRRNAEGATGDWMDEQAAHHTTKRQLAAARGQITKLRKMLS